MRELVQVAVQPAEVCSELFGLFEGCLQLKKGVAARCQCVQRCACLRKHLCDLALIMDKRAQRQVVGGDSVGAPPLGKQRCAGWHAFEAGYAQPCLVRKAQAIGRVVFVVVGKCAHQRGRLQPREVICRSGLGDTLCFGALRLKHIKVLVHTF
ncbi:hypothetical protein EDP1_3149 [Pseudomonas putida S610]|nr:hypothetical protein EDP1_3149 [Pseudomonas putida S610]